MNPNPQQRDVIEHGKGPCLVVAVPGSGKTACLTERIRRLVESGVEPRRILAVTFTNKAAKELRNRLAKNLRKDDAAEVNASTFHSLCAKLLRTFHEEAKLPKDYVIYDSDDQESALKASLCEVLGLETKSEIPDDAYQSVLDYVERTRNACLSDENRSLMPNAWQYQVVEKYFERLRREKAVDFTGLLFKVLELLDGTPDILGICQRRWDYISVDEVQDTNVVQYEIIKRLAGWHRNLFMVGDPSQSIYKFRNANPENLFQFEKEFGAKVLKIEQNYRSTPQVLRHAQKLIENNKFRKDTVLATGNKDGPEPELICEVDQDTMANTIASIVRRRIERGTPPREIAVLYRIRSASRVLEKALRAQRVKYKVIGGFSFWDYSEVKACVSLLRLMANPGDCMAFESFSDRCLKGFGSKSASKIAQQMSSGGSVIEAAKAFSKGKGKSAMVLGGFLVAMEGARGLAPGAALVYVLQAVGFWETIGKKNNEDTGLDRHENIMEVAQDLDQYLGKSTGNTLSGYLQEIALLTSADEEQEEEEVSLMTMHAAKGLEFDMVAISHANQEIIPHWNALNPKDPSTRESEIEEERRLMYVAMTRARQWLHVACCRSRFNKPMKPSQFIREAGLY